MDKETARQRLEKSFYAIEHPSSCLEPDPHFVNEGTDNPHYDGVLTIKCWNCTVQNHFLYNK